MSEINPALARQLHEIIAHDCTSSIELILDYRLSRWDSDEIAFTVDWLIHNGHVLPLDAAEPTCEADSIPLEVSSDVLDLSASE